MENTSLKAESKALQTSSRSAPKSKDKWTPQDKVNIGNVIATCFDLQKQFGKSASQLDNIAKGFCWALGMYDPRQVIEAFGKYILTHADMPTPYDIRQIIDPVREPWKPDKAFYVRLQEILKREGAFGLSQDEIDYIRDYEEFMKNERRQSVL